MGTCLPYRRTLILIAITVISAGCGSNALPQLEDFSLPDGFSFQGPDSSGYGGDIVDSDAMTGDGGSTDISAGDTGATDQGSADGWGGTDADNDGGLLSDGGKTGCAEDKDCKDLVCDKKCGKCVECVEYTDCKEGSDCRANSCELLVNPALPGGHKWSTTSYDLVISGGLFGTTIKLTIYLPEGAGPFPIIVFTHGFQLAPSDYASYAQHMASWGFIVVMPAMPGSLISPTTHLKLKE